MIKSSGSVSWFVYKTPIYPYENLLELFPKNEPVVGIILDVERFDENEIEFVKVPELEKSILVV